jgi:hypothetical protein
MESFTKYIIANDSSKTDEHWNYCEKNKIPHIIGTEIDQFYKIELDMMSTSFKMTDNEVKEIESIIKKEIISNPELKEKSNYSITSSGGDIFPIPKEKLDEFCSKLFEIATKQR